MCGDGLDFGEYECDDGNLKDGDGCSKICKVETGWKCENGTEDRPDKCLYTVRPRIFIKEITSSNLVYVKFSEPISVQ